MFARHRIDEVVERKIDRGELDVRLVERIDGNDAVFDCRMIW